MSHPYKYIDTHANTHTPDEMNKRSAAERGFWKSTIKHIGAINRNSLLWLKVFGGALVFFAVGKKPQVSGFFFISDSNNGDFSLRFHFLTAVWGEIKLTKKKKKIDKTFPPTQTRAPSK